MDKVSINKSGLNVFKRVQETNEKANTSTNTNPFGISFKGSVLSADVFEKASKPVIANVSKEGIAEKGKLFASAIVGNLNNFHSNIKQRWDSIVAIGQKAKEHVSNLWKKANEINVTIPNTITSFKNRMENKNIHPEVKELMEKTPSDLSAMLTSGIAEMA